MAETIMVKKLTSIEEKCSRYALDCSDRDDPTLNEWVTELYKLLAEQQEKQPDPKAIFIAGLPQVSENNVLLNQIEWWAHGWFERCSLLKWAKDFQLSPGNLIFDNYIKQIEDTTNYG